MTIASEITRLQGAKSDIRQAIIDKGVSVSADLTIDDYACCIASIPSGPKYLKYLVVGGGGGGATYGGGGGGEVISGGGYFGGDEFQITIGAGGQGHQNTVLATSSNCGGSSCIVSSTECIIARGGLTPAISSCWDYGGGKSGNGNNGGTACSTTGGGGGGAGGVGGNGTGNMSGCKAGNGGAGLCGYGGGGGGGSGASSISVGQGVDGGGNGLCNATGFGGGGGAGAQTTTGRCKGKNGYQGVVDICYKSDGSYGINSATGGNCCYECNGYCVHRFTSNGTFTITG